MKTKLLFFMLTMALSIGFASAESGTCGENLTWDLTDGILTISGTGEMTDYSSIAFFSDNMHMNAYLVENNSPWGKYLLSIKNIIIIDGVTSIGNNAFYGCRSLTSVTIPNSVTSIGYNAFYNVANIEYHGSAIGAPWGARSVNGFVDGYLVYSDETKTNLLACSSAFVGDLTIPNSVTSIGNFAFYACYGLNSITIPNSVTSIGNDAFNGCNSLTSVTIPNSVTSIGSRAFYNVANIEYHGSAIGAPWGARSVNGFVDGYLVYSDEIKTNLLACSSAFEGELIIPNSVTIIGYDAFYACNNLTSVVIPNSVTSIGGYAFSGCSGLNSITIGNSVTSIQYEAFYGCSNLKEVHISDLAAWCNINFEYNSNPLSIAHNLYLKGNRVTDLTIPNSVTSIGKDAFYNCSSLTSITIPNSVTSIGADAFYKVANIVYYGSATGSPWGAKSVNGFVEGYLVYSDETKSNLLACSSAFEGELTIPNSVTSIGNSAFFGCSGLTSIIIPNSVTSIGGYAFSGCSGLKEVHISDIVAWCMINFESEFSNPLSCAHDLYLNGTLIKDLVIPDNITSIKEYSFYYCSLTSVTIPNCVTSIGNSAFSRCRGLTSITIPNSITSIGSSAFSYCDNLTSVTIPNSVTSISDYTFSSCRALTSVTIPNSVTSIGSYAFSYCYNLTSVTIPNSVTSIGNSAFSRCRGLTSITIPNSITSIGNYAFYECSSLTSVTIPNSVTSIGSSAFSYCYNLTSVTIPNSVTSISDYTFSSCRALTSVTIPNSVTSIGSYAFSYCYNLTSVTIPNSVTSIGSYAFSDCSSLTSVTIPNSVPSIGSYAFSNCSSLTSVTIPNSVTSIGKYVFSSCNNLKYVISLPITPPSINSNTFGLSTNIYVPNNALENYQNAKYWKNLNIKELVNIDKSQINPTSAVIKIIWAIDDNYITSCGMESGEMFEGNSLEYIGLEPNSEYTDVPIVVTSNMGETATINISFTTSALTLTTQPAKPVSANTAILLAETNMADIETSCGFEYKRNDAPADMEGNKVLCPVANGQMAGRLKGLKDDVYYKYRAFYKSSAGNMYYGDWQYIFTGDVAVEFDPILYTYEASNVQETQARLRGYALAGSDDFTEQGFEYWADSRTTPANIIAHAPQATLETIGEHHTIQANGISMSVNLNNLDAGTTYRYRTYAKIGSQTLYGAEMSFTTKGEYTPPTYTITFVNYDNSPLLTLTNVEQGTLPVYTGDTPTRDDDDEYTYTFRGWQPEIVAAEADATYTATYNAAKKTDAIDIISADENSVCPRKIIENGRLYIILPNGKKYTATGEEVR